jgi:hypothetical protein
MNDCIPKTFEIVIKNEISLISDDFIAVGFYIGIINENATMAVYRIFPTVQI